MNFWETWALEFSKIKFLFNNATSYAFIACLVEKQWHKILIVKNNLIQIKSIYTSDQNFDLLIFIVIDPIDTIVLAERIENFIIHKKLLIFLCTNLSILFNSFQSFLVKSTDLGDDRWGLSLAFWFLLTKDEDCSEIFSVKGAATAELGLCPMELLMLFWLLLLFRCNEIIRRWLSFGNCNVLVSGTKLGSSFITMIGFICKGDLNFKIVSKNLYRFWKHRIELRNRWNQ